MTSPLSGVPVAQRRRMAATLGVFAVLLLAVGIVSVAGPDVPAAPVFAVIAFVAAVLLALVAWGMLRSVRIDEADAQLDAAIVSAVAASGRQMCDCGHEHDPGELHVTDACAHDGTGAACTHDCETCVLAALRTPSS